MFKYIHYIDVGALKTEHYSGYNTHLYMIGHSYVGSNYAQCMLLVKSFAN